MKIQGNKYRFLSLSFYTEYSLLFLQHFFPASYWHTLEKMESFLIRFHGCVCIYDILLWRNLIYLTSPLLMSFSDLD